MYEENIENITKSDRTFAPTFFDHHLLPGITFNWHCLINNNIFILKTVTKLYISDTLIPWLRNLIGDFILNNCLFAYLKLTKNTDPDIYKYTGYGIGYNSRISYIF